jgi:hypothetical protein
MNSMLVVELVIRRTMKRKRRRKEIERANFFSFPPLGPVHTPQDPLAARGGIRQTSLAQSEWDTNPDLGP